MFCRSYKLKAEQKLLTDESAVLPAGFAAARNNMVFWSCCSRRYVRAGFTAVRNKMAEMFSFVRDDAKLITDKDKI